ncbi:MAG: hypothetical protein JEZ12_24875 [Desulfobacterium sp.]|nr:hypothetical protein [Desulfobacterium sp.]
MTKQEIELLIRIDQRVGDMEKTIEDMNKQRRCYTNTEKIRSLERIVWTALGASIAAVVKSFWPAGGS